MIKKKVLFVLPWSPSHQGGVTSVVLQLIENWPKKDSLDTYLAVNDWNYPSAESKSDAIYFRFCVIGKHTSLGLLKSMIRLPVSLYRTFTFLRTNNVAAVNFHYPGFAPLGIVLLKWIGLFDGKLVLSYHGTDVYKPRSLVEKIIFNLLFNSADSIVACSRSLADRMVETFHLSSEHIAVIYNGVNVSIFNPNPPVPQVLKQQLPESFILSVGAFIPRKSQKTLLDAFCVLGIWYPDLHLCLAGAEGPDREFLVNHAKAIGLEHKVHFLVNISPGEVAYLLSRTCLCVQAALAESFPLAVLEAGAVGAPLAVSRIKGHDELIFDGETGLLFTAGDSEHCASIIVRALNDRSRLVAMADNFRSRIINELTWDACIEKYRRNY